MLESIFSLFTLQPIDGLVMLLFSFFFLYFYKVIDEKFFTKYLEIYRQRIQLTAESSSRIADILTEAAKIKEHVDSALAKHRKKLINEKDLKIKKASDDANLLFEKEAEKINKRILDFSDKLKLEKEQIFNALDAEKRDLVFSLKDKFYKQIGLFSFIIFCFLFVNAYFLENFFFTQLALASSEGGHNEHGFFSIFYQILNFLLLAFIAWKLYKQKFPVLWKNRVEGLEQQITKSRKELEDAVKKLDQFKEQQIKLPQLLEEVENAIKESTERDIDLIKKEIEQKIISFNQVAENKISMMDQKIKKEVYDTVISDVINQLKKEVVLEIKNDTDNNLKEKLRQKAIFNFLDQVKKEDFFH